MRENLSRRKFLSTGLTATALAGVTGMRLLSLKMNSAESTESPQWPFPYVQLNEEHVMVLAHDSFFRGGCAYGAFHAIIQALREKIGAPFTYIPTDMMKYGKGGGMEWGTLCGALNGAAAAINLVTRNWGALIHELIGLYTQTAYPSNRSNQMAVDQVFGTIMYQGPLAQSVSGSPLCHASVTQWCNVSGFTATSLPRKERCGRLTADVAAKAVEMLNLDMVGLFVPSFRPTIETETCLSCHGVHSVIENVLTDMDCTQCHGIPHGYSTTSSKK
ncbi:MAG: C-GCAxxG-C-C family (seleno)protein [Candidatus Aminicenantales bacterium]